MLNINDSFLSEVLDNLPVGIAIIAPNGKILHVNKSLCFYTARSKEYYVNHSIDDMHASGYIDEPMYVKAVKQRRAITGLHRVGRGDGSSINLMTTQRPFFDEDGNLAYIVSFERDIENEVRHYLETKVISPGPAPTYTKDPPPDFVYRSREMQQLMDSLSPIIPTNVPVLIQGETGTGKEVLAHYIHSHSKLSKRPLISINCAALPESLLESELFGYEKGAFTGAASGGKKGILEEADGGTLFLDEINSLPIALQPKLLRVLETSVVQRLGATKGKHINFRLIVATNANLTDCIANGTFRLDLFYRINAMTVTIPPLRERRDDICVLANHYLEEYCRRYNIEKHFSEAAYQEMQDYNWPGNVRELKNAVERLCLTSNPSGIVIDSFAHILDNSYTIFPATNEPVSVTALNNAQGPDGILSFWDEGLTLNENMEIYESAILREAHAKYKTTSKIAEKTGVNQSTISRKLSKYKIS